MRRRSAGPDGAIRRRGGRLKTRRFVLKLFSKESGLCHLIPATCPDGISSRPPPRAVPGASWPPQAGSPWARPRPLPLRPKAPPAADAAAPARAAAEVRQDRRGRVDAGAGRHLRHHRQPARPQAGAEVGRRLLGHGRQLHQRQERAGHRHVLRGQPPGAQEGVPGHQEQGRRRSGSVAEQLAGADEDRLRGHVLHPRRQRRLGDRRRERRTGRPSPRSSRPRRRSASSASPRTPNMAQCLQAASKLGFIDGIMLRVQFPTHGPRTT